MAVNILRGPAGGGKSQYFEENSEKGDLFLDITTFMGGFAQFGAGPCYWSVSLEVRRVSSFAGRCLSQIDCASILC